MTPHECENCMSKGTYSVNPTLTSLQEIILLHLKELSFYLLKLKDFGVTNNTITDSIIETFLCIVTNAEYNQEQFKEIILKLDKYIQESKYLYNDFCQKNNVEAESVKIYFKHGKDFNLTDAIRKGEKYFLKKSSTLTTKQKDIFEIMLFLLKSICIKLLELKRLGKEQGEGYYALLSMLNTMNFLDFSEERARDEIKKFIRIYYETVRNVFYAQIELYGELTENEVSFSSEPGKAILVSGSDFKKLELVLKAAENTDISVYTHGVEMLMAHAFPKLYSHPNLKGHFGKGISTSLIDFTEFPGPILMTKATLERAEYLYRGRLFTTDPIPPPGVIKIKDDDYEPLIKSALNSEGFAVGMQKPSMHVGFLENELDKKLDEISEKVKSKEIKHLYIVGLTSHPDSCMKYFDRFFEILPDDCLALSLCCNKHEKNIFHLDSFYDPTFLYKTLKRLKQELPLEEINMTVFVTKCDKHIIASLIYLKEIGIKHVYTTKCPTSMVNPALMETLEEMFDIKEISDPQTDLRETLA